MSMLEENPFILRLCAVVDYRLNRLYTIVTEAANLLLSLVLWIFLAYVGTRFLSFSTILFNIIIESLILQIAYLLLPFFYHCIFFVPSSIVLGILFVVRDLWHMVHPRPDLVAAHTVRAIEGTVATPTVPIVAAPTYLNTNETSKSQFSNNFVELNKWIKKGDRLISSSTECSVCYDVCTTVSKKCSHALCSKCYEKIELVNNTVLCPLCRKQIS